MTMLTKFLLLTLAFTLTTTTTVQCATVPQTATRPSESNVASTPLSRKDRKITAGVRGAVAQDSALSSRHLKEDKKGRNMDNDSTSNDNDNNNDIDREEYTNVHGLTEQMPCAPSDLVGVQDRRRSSLTDAACKDNSCGGCCRMYNWLVCDTDNTYDHLQCVCNSITNPLPRSTPLPETVTPTVSPVTPLPTPWPTQPPITAAPSTAPPVSAAPTSLVSVVNVNENNVVNNSINVTLSNATLADRLDEATPAPLDNGSFTISPINTNNNIVTTTSPPATAPSVSLAPTPLPTTLVPVTAPPVTAPPVSAAPVAPLPTTTQPTVGPKTPAPVPVAPWQQCAQGSSYHATAADSGTCNYAENCGNKDECCVRNFCLCAKAKGLEDECVPSRFN